MPWELPGLAREGRESAAGAWCSWAPRLGADRRGCPANLAHERQERLGNSGRVTRCHPSACCHRVPRSCSAPPGQCCCRRYRAEGGFEGPGSGGVAGEPAVLRRLILSRGRMPPCADSWLSVRAATRRHRDNITGRWKPAHRGPARRGRGGRRGRPVRGRVCSRTSGWRSLTWPQPRAAALRRRPLPATFNGEITTTSSCATNWSATGPDSRAGDGESSCGLPLLGRAGAHRLGACSLRDLGPQERRAFGARDNFGSSRCTTWRPRRPLPGREEGPAPLRPVQLRRRRGCRHGQPESLPPLRTCPSRHLHRASAGSARGEYLTWTPGAASTCAGGTTVFRPARSTTSKSLPRDPGDARRASDAHAPDVPVGSFLSSGIDSTAVVALAREFNPNILTFTVGYDVPGYSRSMSQDSGGNLDVYHDPDEDRAEDMIARYRRSSGTGRSGRRPALVRSISSPRRRRARHRGPLRCGRRRVLRRLHIYGSRSR